MIYQFVDWGATYIECFICIAVIVCINGQKLEGYKHILGLVFCAFGNFLLVAFLNSLQLFSFITPMVSIAFLFCMSAILSKGTRILRISSCFMVLFVILAVGYIWMLFVCLLHGGEFEIALQSFTTFGPLRCIYLVLDKSSDIILYFLLRKHLSRLTALQNHWLILLLCGSAFAYGATQYLMGAILSHNIYTMRQASIVSYLVLLLFFLVFSILLLTISSRDQERADRLVLQQTERLMEKNYQMLHKDLQENAKRIHDFHHHLQAILGFAEQTGDEKTQQYIHSLLEISYRDIRLCNSGNDIIDAVINCSAAEAARLHIDFQYHLDLSSNLSQISPVDLCAVLGNQIENALEACKKIPETQNRSIQVIIRQNKGFLIIQVANSTLQNPFTANGQLISEKDIPELHGLGLKSIQDTADKYNGYLKNTYADHVFNSEVLLCLTLS